MTDLSNASEWLKAKKVRVGEKLVYSFKASCCGTLHQWAYGEKPETCPACGAIYWDKPKHEYHLFVMQDDWFKNGNRRVLDKMFEVMLDYSRIIVAGTFKASNVTVTQEYFDDTCRDIAYKLLEFPLLNKRINLSFGAMIHKIKLGPLYKDQHTYQTLSLNDKEPGEKAEFWEKQTTKIDTLVTHENHLESQAFQDNTRMSEELTKITEYVHELVHFNSGSTGSLIFLSGLVSRLSKRPAMYMNKFYAEFGNQARDYIEKAELAFFAYLKDVQEKVS